MDKGEKGGNGVPWPHVGQKGVRKGKEAEGKKGRKRPATSTDRLKVRLCLSVK